MTGPFDEGADEIALVVFRKRATRAAGGDREAGECRELASKRLGGGNANFRPRQRRDHSLALARDRRGRYVDDGERVLAMLLGVAERSERVGGLARLRDEDRKPVLRHRRIAVAEFRRDIEIDRKPREALEPVL